MWATLSIALTVERVANQLEVVLGADHPDTLIAWGYLAVSYRSAGRAGEAITILERVAARRESH
jgi:hypothetical protein